MHLSKYLKVYPAEPGKVLLFSTKRFSSVMVSEELYEAMKAGNLSGTAEKTLKELGFLVEDLADERREMQQSVDEANEKRIVCNVVVVMNLDCNLDCIYCFEGLQKGKKYMAPRTADAIVDFLVRMSYEKGKYLRVTFYGGEPLMSVKLIKVISRKLLERSGGQKFIASMVTNGLLLTRKRVEELIPYGFSGAKVTLDGLRENHNRYRPLRSGGGSFDTIVENIKDTCDLIRIGLGGNYTEENYRDFPKLLDYLIAEGITPDKLGNVSFSAIFKTHQDYILPEYRDMGCEGKSEDWAEKAGYFLREEIMKRGFSVAKLQAGACTVEFKDDIVINYDGDCYKCPAFVGHEKLRIGTVFDGIGDYGESHSLVRWRNQECMNCEYLPLCFGGCRLMTFLSSDNMEGVDCKKNFYDSSLEGIVKQDMKYITKVGS